MATTGIVFHHVVSRWTNDFLCGEYSLPFYEFDGKVRCCGYVLAHWAYSLAAAVWGVFYQEAYSTTIEIGRHCFPWWRMYMAGIIHVDDETGDGFPKAFLQSRLLLPRVVLLESPRHLTNPNDQQAATLWYYHDHTMVRTWYCNSSCSIWLY